MRRLADAERVQRFMQAVGAAAKDAALAYFTGGASAVLLGWRASTVDVAVKFIPERDEILRSLPGLKERLDLNIELVWPSDFIPELPGWDTRSRFVATEGPVSFYHYDFYSQCLAKIERGHAQDVEDVRAMVGRGLVDAAEARRLFHQIEPLLYRYPALDPPSFRRAVESLLGGLA